MRTCSNPNGCSNVVFRTDKLTRKGYCKFCYPRLSTDIDKRSIIQKAISKNAKKNEMTKIRSLISEDSSKMSKPPKDERLTNWFKFHMINSKMVCDNCGADLSHYNEKDWLSSQHHVLEKALYKTTATILENHLVLGKWCCHSIWHSSYHNARKMKVWGRAVEIVKKLYPILTDKEKGRARESFNLD